MMDNFAAGVIGILEKGYFCLVSKLSVSQNLYKSVPSIDLKNPGNEDR